MIFVKILTLMALVPTVYSLAELPGESLFSEAIKNPLSANCIDGVIAKKIKYSPSELVEVVCEKNGKFHGEVRSVVGGTLVRLKTYRNGIPDGFFYHGTKGIRGKFENGRPVEGTWLQWNVSTKEVKDELDERAIVDVGLLACKEYEHLSWTQGIEDEDPHRSYQACSSGGKFEGPRVLFSKDSAYKISAIDYWADGLRDGPVYGFWPNGKLKMEALYLKGKEVGAGRIWSSEGVKVFEGEWVDNRQTGKFSEWYESGKKKSEGMYKDDVKIGVWTYWDEAGKATTENPEQRKINEQREAEQKEKEAKLAAKKEKEEAAKIAKEEAREAAKEKAKTICKCRASLTYLDVKKNRELAVGREAGVVDKQALHEIGSSIVRIKEYLDKNGRLAPVGSCHEKANAESFADCAAMVMGE